MNQLKAAEWEGNIREIVDRSDTLTLLNDSTTASSLVVQLDPNGTNDDTTCPYSLIQSAAAEIEGWRDGFLTMLTSLLTTLPPRTKELDMLRILCTSSKTYIHHPQFSQIASSCLEKLDYEE